MSQEHREKPLQWQSPEVVQQWQKEAKRRQEDLAEATQRMLTAAELKPGDRVLDIAAGTGDQSILAARMVGPEGLILATDLSAEMLKAAAKQVEQEGLSNITPRVMDAQQLELEDQSFDAVICRFGLMLISNREQALTEIRRVLKPGGKLAALVWSTSEHNPLYSCSLGLLAKYPWATSAQLPDPYSLAGPGVFERALRNAGFREVTIETIPIQMHYASMDVFIESRRKVAEGMVGQQSQEAVAQWVAEVRKAVSQFEGPDGLVAPGETLLGIGTKQMSNGYLEKNHKRKF